MTQTEMMLIARNCEKNYLKENVLKNFNMNVSRGSIYCLMGSSGVGKTTLLHCIVGITSLDGGSIKKSVNFPNIGFMPQSLNLTSNLTIKEMLEYYAKIYGCDGKEFVKRFAMLDEMLEFPPCDQLIGKLSGGEKRRISLAAAFIHQPDLVVLDEPTVGLDHLLRLKIWNFIRSQVTNFNVTIILSTHYASEAAIADRIGMMKEGKLQIEASPREAMRLSGKDDLHNAISFLYRANVEMKCEEVEEEIEVEKTRRTEYFGNGILPLMKKDLKVMQRCLVFYAIFTFIPVFATYFFFAIYGAIPMRTVFIKDRQTFNCTKDSNFFNIPCLYTDELLSIPCFHVTSESLKSSHIILEFVNGIESLNCTEAYKSLDLLKMKKRFLVVEFQKKHFINELYKNIFLYAYQSMTAKIFKQCNISVSEELIKVADMEGNKLGLEYNGRSLYALMYMILLPYVCTMIFLSVIHEKANSTWNSTILSGVSIHQIFLTTTITHLPIFALMTFFLKIYEFYMFGKDSIEGNILMTLLIAVAVLQGLLLSFTNFTIVMLSSFYLLLSTFYMFVTGVVKPMEAMPEFLQNLSYSTPITWPSIAAFECVKNSSKCSSSFNIAIIVLTSWICGQFFLLLFCSRRKLISERIKMEI